MYVLELVTASGACQKRDIQEICKNQLCAKVTSFNFAVVISHLEFESVSRI